MNRFIFSLLFFCAFAACEAQMLPSSKPLPTYMADSAGQPILMDFNISLVGISDPNMPFSVFSSRPLVIYYFSPFCPHCQKGYGGVQQMAKEYEPRGLASIAVSVSNVSKRDILGFIEQQKGSMPFFQDIEQGFGKKYGDGYVPRLYLVSSDGKVVRYTDSGSENLPRIKADIEKLL
jgi:thiol-disulfide isomerase/thioredoxin